eukprot:Tbor_TRINITY_DN5983_c1_g4::TRINITY_DN5983_c1_g4_i1::g.18652::m.18652
MDYVDMTLGPDSAALTSISLKMPIFTSSNGSSSGFTALRPPRTAEIYCIPREKWIPDNRVVECMATECRQQFSFFNRRHHCRVCGKIYCASCCSENIPRYMVSNSTRFFDVQNTHLPAERDLRVSNDSNNNNNNNKNTHNTGLLVSSNPAYSSTNNSNNNNNNNNTNIGINGIRSQQLTTPYLSPITSETRMCKECCYNHQLAINRREATGHPRRRHRGELKMIQRARIVDIFSFLSFKELLNVSLVSSDFYFITRDNNLWMNFNALRWESDNSRHHSSIISRQLQPHYEQTSPITSTGVVGYGASRASSKRPSTAGFLLRGLTTANGEISNHCRYNYTQFLKYCTLLENARCGGLANFASNAKLLLMKSVKVAVIGPAMVGKSVMIQHFADEMYSNVCSGVRVFSPTHVSHHRRTASYAMGPFDRDAYRPTCGLVVSHKKVTVTGEISLPQSGVIIYDVSGGARYEKLRGLVCRSVHVIILCYNVSSKGSLKEAVAQMSSIESLLGPQPVVLCGIIDQAKSVKEVTESDASSATARCKASLQIFRHDAIVAFETAIQVVLDRLMVGGKYSSELVSLSTNPSVFDLLIDPKGM